MQEGKKEKKKKKKGKKASDVLSQEKKQECKNMPRINKKSKQVHAEVIRMCFK